MSNSPFFRRIKRLTDILVSGLGMVVLSPLFLYAALQVPRSRGSTIIFRQQRPGLHGKPFLMYKFRTMSDARDAEGKLLPDAERLTERGRFLRHTSLDELPELWNVLKGDMSLVGPRPLLMEYLDRYTPEQMRRHEVRPGITGLAQISGRNNVPWEQKFELDVWYVDNWSLVLDAKILFRTISQVIKRSNISQSGHATMSIFEGVQRQNGTVQHTLYERRAESLADPEFPERTERTGN
ncbi:MAG: sugar transferase [Thermomicrobiales bacterium]